MPATDPAFRSARMRIKDAPELADIGLPALLLPKRTGPEKLTGGLPALANGSAAEKWKFFIAGIAADISVFNRDNLPSLRGYHTVSKEDAAGNRENKTLSSSNPLVFIADLALSPFRQMGRGDWLPFLANIINIPLTALEYTCKFISGAAMLPYAICLQRMTMVGRNTMISNTRTEELALTAQKIGWGLLAGIAAIPAILSFPVALAGKVCSYTRAVIDSTACLLNPRWLFSPIAGFIANLAGKQTVDDRDAINSSQKTIAATTSLTSLAKNSARLGMVALAGAALVVTGGLAASSLAVAPLTAYAGVCAASFGALLANGLGNVAAWKLNEKGHGPSASAAATANTDKPRTRVVMMSEGQHFSPKNNHRPAPAYPGSTASIASKSPGLKPASTNKAQSHDKIEHTELTALNNSHIPASKTTEANEAKNVSPDDDNQAPPRPSGP